MKRKAESGTSEGFNFVVKVDTLETNGYFKLPFGRRLDDARRVNEFKATAKSYHVDCKGKATLPAVKRFIREEKPSQYFASWRSDSANWKDDTVQLFYVD